jgi:hypothetical protein
MKNVEKGNRTIKVPEGVLLSLKMIQQKEKGNDLLVPPKPFHHFIREWIKLTDNKILEEAEKAIQRKNNDNQNEEV